MAVAGMLPGWPRINLAIAFNTGGTQGGSPLWNDVTGRLRGSWTATGAGRQYELDAVQAGTASWTLDNTDGAFDSTNPSSPFYGSIRPYRLLRLTATWPPSANQLPQDLATGAGTGTAVATVGTLSTAPVAAAPSGHTQAIAWALPPSTAAAVGQGHNGAFSQCDPTAVPVAGQPGQVPGQPWSLSLYLSAAAGGQAGLQMWARISWYGQSGARIATTDGTPVTVPAQPGWVRVQSSGTAPVGAVWARAELTTSQTTTTATVLYLTGWQFEQAAAPSPWVDPGTTYPLWAGYVERFRQQWPKGTAYGTVDVGAVDALAGLARLTLQPSLQQTLAALGPTAMYPFNEAAGAEQFADATGRRAARLPLVGPAGAGSATITSGAAVQGTGSVGSAGPVVTITNPAAGLTSGSQPGMFIGPPPSGPFGPPTSGGWTRVVCFRTTVKPSAAMVLWSSMGPGAGVGGSSSGSKAYVNLFIDANGHFAGSICNADGSAAASVGVADIYCPDGAWHIAIVQLSADGTTWTVACDDHGYEATTTGDYHPTGCASDAIGGTVLGSNAIALFSGDVAYATEVPYEIGNDAAYDIGTGFSLGWLGDTSTRRAQRILTMAGYPGQLASLNTVEVMGPADLANQNAGAALQTVADSEAGQIYADPAGVVTLAGRRWRYLQSSPAIVLGENTAAGEVPYLGDVAVDLDPDHIYNTVQVTNQGPPNGAQQPDTFASNPVSAAEYFPSSLARTINVKDPGEPFYAAAYLAGQYAEPQPRVSRVTVDPSANPSLWPAVLGLAFGTRARLNRRPNASPNTVRLDTYVEQIEWRGDDQGQLQVSLQQSAAAPYSGWLIAAALHTTLAAPATAGAATITLAALTGSATNPAAAVLPGGTALTVGYATPLAETVTVAPAGVATTSPGYTSVVVTLTAPLANAHPPGAVVCQPLPAAVTLPASTTYPAGLDAAATLTATGGPRAAY
ncbi:hypothetical protein [Kitasatospora sp. GAS1066B]|uniref:hypothetical protein n=1 Tax=Kitasatospora sp. GAS1066B TaxID=3156271 RepID=UPI003517E180